MTDIRSSKIGLHLACGQSLVEPDIPIRRNGPEAALGTAGHWCLEKLISDSGAELYIPELAAAVAQVHAVDADELTTLVRAGVRAWRAIEPYFPPPRRLEEPLPAVKSGGIRLTTRGVDLLSDCGDEVRVLDWKLGFIDADATDQLRAYCWLALSSNPAWQRARACKVQLRQRAVDWYEWTREELAAWWADAVRRLTDTAPAYNPTPDNCRYCPRSHECPAKAGALRNIVTLFADRETVMIGPPSPDALATIWQNLTWLERAIGDAREFVREEVAAAGGTLGLADGRELRLKPVTWRVITDPVLASNVLDKHLTTDAIGRTLSMSKGKVEKELGNIAPARGKGRLIAAVMNELTEAGALTEQPQSPRLEITRPAQQLTQEENR